MPKVTLTKIKIIPFDPPKGKMMAIASFCIGPIAFNSFRIMSGSKGIFAGPPSQKNQKGEWFEIVKFLDKEVYRNVQDQLKAAYEEEVGSPSVPDSPPSDKEEENWDLPF